MSTIFMQIFLRRDTCHQMHRKVLYTNTMRSDVGFVGLDNCGKLAVFFDFELACEYELVTL